VNEEDVLVIDGRGQHRAGIGGEQRGVLGPQRWRFSRAAATGGEAGSTMINDRYKSSPVAPVGWTNRYPESPEIKLVGVGVASSTSMDPNHRSRDTRDYPWARKVPSRKPTGSVADAANCVAPKLHGSAYGTAKGGIAAGTGMEAFGSANPYFAGGPWVDAAGGCERAGD
jgi:hypothetical protein